MGIQMKVANRKISGNTYLRKLYSNSFPKKLKMMQRKLFTFKFVATRPSFLNSLHSFSLIFLKTIWLEIPQIHIFTYFSSVSVPVYTSNVNNCVKIDNEEKCGTFRIILSARDIVGYHKAKTSWSLKKIRSYVIHAARDRNDRTLRCR